MQNLENKIQVLTENAKAANLTIREFVEIEKDNDPNFFRWLFDEDFENDFDANLSEDQKEEFENFFKII